jgi:hypothetical protein
MATTTRTTRSAAAPIKTAVPTPKRFLCCIACGTWKKERSYALCAECFRVNGKLSPAWFRCFVRHVEREEAQYSFRSDPRFGKACRIYARRRQRREAQAATLALLPKLSRHETDPRSRDVAEEYDGLGSYDLGDLLDWQMYDVTLPEPERTEHRDISDAEIARWDARVDAWAKAHGFSLADEPTPEIQPWGHWVEIDGARVWTDDLA